MDKYIRYCKLKLKMLSILHGCTIFLVTLNMSGQTDTSLKVHYLFKNLTADSSKVIDDSGNGDTATFQSGAVVRTIGNHNVLDLGITSGYLDLGSKAGNVIATLDSFTIATYLFIEASV